MSSTPYDNTRPRLKAVEVDLAGVHTTIAGIQLQPGVKGDPGIQGPAGVPGAAGVAGAKGDKGDPGIQGEKGTDGAAGVAGAKGDKGDQGLKGDAGVAGAKGNDGAAGAAGTPGAKGDQGIQGIQGLKGDTGSQGQQGIQGLAGVKGSDGAAGAAGVAGAKGDKGDKGDQGIPGSPATNLVQSVNTKTGVVVLTADNIDYPGTDTSVAAIVDSHAEQLEQKVPYSALDSINESLAEKVSSQDLTDGLAGKLDSDTFASYVSTTGDTLNGKANASDLNITEGEINSHRNDHNNPHAVTKAQVGLGNLSNVDTTNAANIITGVFAVARIPTLPYLSTSGGTINGNIVLKGASGFTGDAQTAEVDFGDSNHGFLAKYNYGLQIKTYLAPTGITLNQNTGNVGIGYDFDQSQAERLKVNGSVKATSFTGDGSALTKLSKSKTITIAPPQTNDNIPIFFTDVAITIGKVISSVVGGTSAQGFSILNGTDRTTAAGTIATVSTSNKTTGDIANISGAASAVPANSHVWLTTDGTTPTVTQLTVTIIYY